MSYNKTTWQNGDTITAEKLNNIEEGIEKNINNIKIVKISAEYENGTAKYYSDTSYNELKEIQELGIPIIVNNLNEFYNIEQIIINGSYSVSLNFYKIQPENDYGTIYFTISAGDFIISNDDNNSVIIEDSAKRIQV